MRPTMLSRALALAGVALIISTTGVLAADGAVLDPDGAAPFTEDSSSPSFDLGDICQNTDASHDVLVKAKNGTGNAVWANSAVLALTVASITGTDAADVTAGAGSPSTLTLQSDWNSLLAGEYSTGAATGTYTVNSAALGARSALVKWTLTGAKNGGGSLAEDTPNIHVNWNIIDCSAPSNVPPTVDAGGTYAGGEGGDINLDGASASDSDGSIASVLWTIDSESVGSGSCSLGNASSLTLATINCTDDGVAIVKLTATDNDGASTFDTANVTVDNVAPTGTFNTPSTDVNEGASFSLSISGASDPSSVDTAAGFMYAFDCGDGAGYGAFSSTDNATCNSAVDGPATLDVGGKVEDKDGGVTGYTGSVTVDDVKPTPTIDSLTGIGGVACIGGNTATLGFSWTDPAETYDTYNYDVNWGDGSTHDTAGFPGATLLYADKTVTGLTHTFGAGTWTIAVTVNDSDTGAGTTVSSDPFSFLYSVTGVLQPVNDTQAHQDPSIFKYGSTIPVKIEITDCNGTPVSGLSPQISVKKISGSTPPTGTDEVISSTSGADTGTTMRWSDPLYIYNLATKSLADSTATYQITITGPFPTVTALFGTKSK